MIRTPDPCMQGTHTLSIGAAHLGYPSLRRSLHVRPFRPSHVPGSTAALLVSVGFLVFWLLPGVRGFRPVLARGWHGEPGTRLQMVAPSSPHPSSGGDQPKGKQEQLYSEYHIVLHGRMIAFGHDAQFERGSERAECACAPPLSFTYADGESRTDGYAQQRRDSSPAVHEYLLVDHAVGTIMRLNTSGHVLLSAGTSNGFRETSTIPGGGSGSGLLPEPRR